MTFDLDGESPWLHRDPARAERPLHMSMGAYGPKTGMPRILELLTYTPRLDAESSLPNSSSTAICPSMTANISRMSAANQSHPLSKSTSSAEARCPATPERARI